MPEPNQTGALPSPPEGTTEARRHGGFNGATHLGPERVLGELLVRSPTLMAGYDGEPTATAAVLGVPPDRLEAERMPAELVDGLIASRKPPVLTDDYAPIDRLTGISG